MYKTPKTTAKHKKASSQMEYNNIVTFDLADLPDGFASQTIELKAQLRSGGFQKICELDLYTLFTGNDLYFPLFKVGIKGQKSQ